VIHVTGHLDWPWVSREGECLPAALRGDYHPYPYLHEELADALAAADLLVNRAGASNLGELPAVGLPAVLVPYPHAGRHQHINAAFLVEQGAARLVEDEALAHELVPTVLELLKDTAVRQRMAEAARSLARTDATRRIIDLMSSMVKERR
jgi:UDP-N-acetylglucosamine--N-acetylmuramyl-(pentapeptide) pyrophosphoryl-undecaprenol N-acetylglucosamine transferase